jgi:hypothetical protein
MGSKTEADWNKNNCGPGAGNFAVDPKKAKSRMIFHAWAQACGAMETGFLNLSCSESSCVSSFKIKTLDIARSSCPVLSRASDLRCLLWSTAGGCHESQVPLVCASKSGYAADHYGTVIRLR